MKLLKLIYNNDKDNRILLIVFVTQNWSVNEI